MARINSDRFTKSGSGRLTSKLRNSLPIRLFLIIVGYYCCSSCKLSRLKWSCWQIRNSRRGISSCSMVFVSKWCNHLNSKFEGGTALSFNSFRLAFDLTLKRWSLNTYRRGENGAFSCHNKPRKQRSFSYILFSLEALKLASCHNVFAEEWDALFEKRYEIQFFIPGGDYNARYVPWSSALNNNRDKNLWQWFNEKQVDLVLQFSDTRLDGIWFVTEQSFSDLVLAEKQDIFLHRAVRIWYFCPRGLKHWHNSQYYIVSRRRNCPADHR